MESWQKKLLEIASNLEEKIDKQRFKLKKEMGWVSPATIQAYRGYGGKGHIWMSGRVLENEGLDLPEKNASIWQNVASLYHRYESDEIPLAKIAYKISEEEGIISANEEGFFNLHLSNFPLKLNNEGKWKQVQMKLVEPYQEGQEEVNITGEIQLPQPTNTFGLISDVDDTIIVTKAIDFLDKMRIFILRNSHTRKPFEGVGAFYRALEGGVNQNAQNPIFYVSSSSWNLYDVLDQFCKINKIPKGTFLLRELGMGKNKFIRGGHEGHKLKKIKSVLETYPDLPFILIGDSGQKDPEIYLEVVNRFPGRIKVIYIRDVRPDMPDSRDLEVKAIGGKVNKKGVEMILVKNSMEAAQHAVEIGLIKEESLQEIEQEAYEEKNSPGDISHLLGLDHFL